MSHLKVLLSPFAVLGLAAAVELFPRYLAVSHANLHTFACLAIVLLHYGPKLYSHCALVESRSSMSDKILLAVVLVCGGTEEILVRCVVPLKACEADPVDIPLLACCFEVFHRWQAPRPSLAPLSTQGLGAQSE